MGGPTLKKYFLIFTGRFSQGLKSSLHRSEGQAVGFPRAASGCSGRDACPDPLLPAPRSSRPALSRSVAKETEEPETLTRAVPSASPWQTCPSTNLQTGGLGPQKRRDVWGNCSTHYTAAHFLVLSSEFPSFKFLRKENIVLLFSIINPTVLWRWLWEEALVLSYRVERFILNLR